MGDHRGNHASQVFYAQGACQHVQIAPVGEECCNGAFHRIGAHP